MWERPSPLAGYFTTCGNLNGDGTFAYRAAGLPLTLQRLTLLAVDHFRAPENRLYADGSLNGSTWEARHELASVVYSDKCSGTNHTLPTMGAGRYTGGLWVGSYLKVSTHQWLDERGVALVAAIAARQSATEGLEGHRRAAVARMKPGRIVETAAISGEAN